MKIYTKTGDAGETSLFGGKRVPKDDLRIEAYGTIDELNSIIGVIRAMQLHEEIDVILERLQHDLFVIGADLATTTSHTSASIPRIKNSNITVLEKIIDTIDSKLEPLKVFILPGGTLASSYLHFARTVCRRAERGVVHLSHSEEINNHVVIYLNRLSDLLFVLARYANFLEKKEEVKWKSGKR